jgi:hypothetical protein
MHRRASAALLTLTLLGGLGSASLAGKRDDGGHNRDTRSDGKCKGAGQCSDDDFSPSFDKSPVYICLPNATCSWGGANQQAMALVPPNPQKLIEAIQAGAAGIGKAAGELAGAIASLPPAILL